MEESVIMDDLRPLTDPFFRIGVCRNCGRYGQISREERICAVAEPKGIVGEEHFKRIRYCQRVMDKRAAEALVWKKASV